jgi:hypothetical protein
MLNLSSGIDVTASSPQPGSGSFSLMFNRVARGTLPFTLSDFRDLLLLILIVLLLSSGARSRA